MEVPMLGASAAKARQQQPAPEPENALIEAETAFIVYRELDGEVSLTRDLDTPFAVDRQAHPHDIIGMATAVEAPEIDADYFPDTEIAVSTAFLVYRLPGGEVLANTDLDAPVCADREPHAHDIEGMLEAVVRDVDTISHAPYFANAVVQAQMQVGQAMRQQMEHAQIQQKLAGGK